MCRGSKRASLTSRADFVHETSVHETSESASPRLVTKLWPGASQLQKSDGRFTAPAKFQSRLTTNLV
ncbi:MAG: hypothetical protein QOE55_7747 [Acidobacteriaceae bacterium]|nr:hypothetical protein [Acidobacteriaceae bacterium]